MDDFTHRRMLETEIIRLKEFIQWVHNRGENFGDNVLQAAAKDALTGEWHTAPRIPIKIGIKPCIFVQDVAVLYE